MAENQLNYFRPKARHIFTIGKDLIKDDFSALIELIKNAYDADAKNVFITFEKLDTNELKIVIKDDGRGMTEEIIRSKWLVPSTDNKKIDKESPCGRVFQGQKGIGRYATSVLGNILKLETVSNGKKTIVDIDWDYFDNTDKFLDEIYLDIKKFETKENNGTYIEIIGDNNKLNIWNDINKQNKFKIELQKLKPPFDTKDEFNINLTFFGKNEEINYDQVLDYFDYKIKGKVDGEGNASFVYINNDSGKEEEINMKLKIESTDNDIKGKFEYPGIVTFELLSIDLEDIKKREKVSRSFGKNFNRAQWIRYYKDYAGVSIYRGGFRIRPYGEKNEDWLHLNSRRVNNPTLRLSTNQLLGYITIQGEDQSHLIEASSREKLKENEYYYGLIYELRQIINELEKRRFKYRGDTGLKDKLNKEINIEEKIEKLQTEIKNIASEEDKNKAIVSTKKLGDDFQKEKERLEKIITQYEGQVTLGKLLSITFHEISKPTKYIRENLPNIKFYIDQIETKLIGGLGDFGIKMLNLLKGYETNAKIVSEFMSKNLQPLVKGKGKPTYFKLENIINLTNDLFSSELFSRKIKLLIEIDKNIKIYGYERDFLIAFTNFVDNSIYWLNEVNIDNKEILIKSVTNGDLLEIYFKDNGLGLINTEENDDIFEPGFTRKENGTGLGLSIAGEVLNKNNVDLKVVSNNELNNEKYNFILKLIVKEWKQ